MGQILQDLPEGQTGQIKIDLSKGVYEIATMTTDRGKPRERIRRRKYPTLSSIISILEKTRAKVLRTRIKGKYTIIDYIA